MCTRFSLAAGALVLATAGATAAQDDITIGMVLEPPNLDPTGGAAAAMLTGDRGAAIVEGRELAGFKQALGDRAGEVREAAAISGINYSKGKRVTLHVFVRP